LYSLWLEAKDLQTKEIKSSKLMTTHELEVACQVPQIQDFYKRVFLVLERFMKVMSRENQVLPALIVDSLFKSMLLKLDKVYEVKSKEIELVQSLNKAKYREMREACSNQMDSQMEQYKFRLNEHVEVIEELSKRVEVQTKTIDQLKKALYESRLDMQKLVSPESRIDSLNSMQDRFEQFKDYLNEHQQHKERTTKLLREYTTMIDIATTKKTKHA
jgi:uncharacterized coiled-coil protein SlyX